LTLDAANVREPRTPRRQRRLEFIGDSITAGFCKGPGPFDPTGTNKSDLSTGDAVEESAESFALSWPHRTCERLNAECSTLAWSGLGLIRNCCGGNTTVPELWSRTVATDESSRWRFASWIPAALVVNLGTNDGSAGETSAFVAAYQELMHRAISVYGPGLHVFLACGPMRTGYCDSVRQTLGNASASGLRAHFLDHRDFLNGTFGPSCCGHPGAQVDAAMASFSADVIARALGWSVSGVGMALWT